MPRSPIHVGIIETLSDFALITRYYNLDYVTDREKSARSADPLRTWHCKVTVPILDRHYRTAQQRRRTRNAKLVETLIGDDAYVRHHFEAGDPLDTVFAVSLNMAKTDHASPCTRMYFMQLMRFLALLLSALSVAA